ncbi:MAG: DUF4331 family protein [Chromatiales bacterium]|jgi:hypothetical protein|nr:DUF4331 family protein [Chromatiales bacterium]
MRTWASAFKSIAIGTVAALVSSAAVAGDHQDGAEVLTNPRADLVGLYAFIPIVGGERGPLAIALGAVPFALNKSEIGNDIEYAVRIKPATLVGTGADVHTSLGRSEMRLACNFYRGKYELNCELTHSADGASPWSVVAVVKGPIDRSIFSKDRALRVMAGLRADPYMTNVKDVRNCLDDREHEFKTKNNQKIKNSFVESKVNFIGIMAEIDRSVLPREVEFPLLAVVGETIEIDDFGAHMRRIDRIGRPETSSFLIRDNATRDAWNAHDPFAGRANGQFRDAMQRGLSAVDSHSRMNFWGYPHPLLNLLLDDYLLVNPRKGIAPIDTARNHYFELEWAAYQGQNTKDLAGGRRPVDNVVERFYSVLARQGQAEFSNLKALRHALYRQTHASFPYLAAPFRGRLETLSNRAIVQAIPLEGTISGCQ